MKIILINYRYYISGGPERYMFNIKEILERKGHEVIPFSVKHNKNVPSKYDDYFLDPIGSGDEMYGHEYKRDIKTMIQVFGRMVYSLEAKRKLKRLITDQKPDLIYILQFQNKISCSVIDAAYELKIPIVQRISDFGHICIDNIFYQYKNNKICERCLHGSKLNAVKYKCSNDSYANSIIKVLALKIQDLFGTRKKITSYIIPSSFTASKFIDFGIPKNKIHHIPTFFNDIKGGEKIITYDKYFVYLGRIDPDKGLFTLVKAFENTPYKLVIIGFSINGYDKFLKNYLENKNHNISFTGKLEFNEISEYLQSCLCTICPSEWYDNLPNAVLESFAYKKPVIASRIGSLQDTISDRETGLHFETGNINDLKKALNYMYSNNSEAVRMGENAYSTLIRDYSTEMHYSRLLNVFEDTIRIKKHKIK